MDLWRGGWAAIGVNEEGAITCGFDGTCDEEFPSALRAELQGVTQCLRHALPQLIIHVDAKLVVDGWFAGRHYCVCAESSAADLWRILWDLLDDIGPGIELVKCKGHATDLDIAEGRATVFTKVGNGHADLYAVTGRELAEDLSPTEVHRKAFKEATSFYRYLLWFCG